MGMTGTVERNVARRNDETAKIDAEVLRKARIVCAYRQMTLAEYLSEKLAPSVDADLRVEQERERERASAKPKPKK
jgi:hypothetical protein